MNRREFSKSLAASTTLLLPRVALASSGMIEPATHRTHTLREFEKLQFGVSFHFSMNTFTGNDYETGNVPASTYNPTNLDVGQWIRVARDLGARYAVLTAKHMSGFCLWDSANYDYDVAASPNKTDVVAEFVKVCKEYRLKHGFYYCILDPHNEGKFDWDIPVQEGYYKLIKQQLTELHSKYPNTFYQLLDITWKLSDEQRWEVYELIKKYSPHGIVVMNQAYYQSKRNVGRICEPKSWPTDVINGEDTLPPPERHDPNVKFQGKTYYMPMEAWMPTGPPYKPMPPMHSWFWRPGFTTQSADTIASYYSDCRKLNSNLLLNLSPDTSGRLPEEAVNTLQEAARIIKRNSNPVRTIKGPAIFLAQFAGDNAPFNNLRDISRWAASLGYKGVQIPTWDSRLFDLKHAAESKPYCDEIRGVLSANKVELTELSTHLQGQLVAVHSAYDEAFDGFAPNSVHNNPSARQAWAVEQLKYAAKASANLGLTAHVTFSGALAWPYFYPWPQRPPGLIETAFDELAKRWKPILDLFDSVGVDLCFEIHPGEDLHDGATFEMFLERLGGHKRCNILYDPSHFVLQQLDYLEHIDIYHERIKMFHVKDAEFRSSGRQGVYGGYQPWISRAGRFRSLGDGQVDFAAIFSKLAQYDFPGWAVLEWECCLKNSEQGAKEGAPFIASHIIQTAERAFDDFAKSGADDEANRRMLGLTRKGA